MLQVRRLRHEYDPRRGPVLDDLSFSVLPGERVALVGRNGCGKSTLIRLLVGELQVQSGRVMRPVTIGYTRQEAEFAYGGLASEYLEERAEGDLALAAKARRHAARLGFRECFWDHVHTTLSLGERSRIEMALLLAQEPDALVLDEPTNHLDLPARQWLAEFLSNSPLPIVMACHDRTLLDTCATRVLEFEAGKVRAWTGNFSDMIRMKEQMIERGMEQFERETQEVRRLKNVAEKALQATEQVTKRPTGRTYDPKAKGFYRGVQSAMARRAKAVRTRVVAAAERKIDKPFVSSKPEVEFPTCPIRSEIALQVSSLGYSVGGRMLFERLTFSVARGERVAIVGPNGCGKTTLFRILLDEIEPDTGRFEWGSSVRAGLVSQDRGTLEPEEDAVGQFSPEQKEFAHTLLARLAMGRATHHTLAGQLSPGERTKIEIAKLIAERANFLILDEPTNHLDIDSLEALEEALSDFPGAVLFSSHDQTFVDRVADEVIYLPA